MKFLRSIPASKLDGAVALVRIDLNVEFESKEDMYRLAAAIPTMRFLLDRGAKVVIVSHRGRPVGFEKKESLRPFVSVLSKKLGQAVRFFPDFDFRKIAWEIATSASRVFLLENIRFLPGETENSAVLGHELASLADIYVNDAFADSHRAHASVSAVARTLPAYAGLGFERELKNLSVLRAPAKPFVAVLGGVKVEDKIALVKAFRNSADAFLLGGGIANTFFAGIQVPVGKSVYDKKIAKKAKAFLRGGKMVLPEDVVTYRGRILDIGKNAGKDFADFIIRAKTVVWTGPLGHYHDARWSAGTLAVWRAIQKNKRANMLVGGGETLASLRLIGEKPETFMKKHPRVFLSTGGGAMVEYLSGKRLPGLHALEASRKSL
jgi:phosphoglycerate kinase